ncbi:MAG: hypothetical protein ABW215_12995, partial [Kibdelosporangium sp.]
MAESPGEPDADLFEMQEQPADDERSRRRAPYALLAAAGVAVATASAALASFAVTANGEAQTSDSPPVVSSIQATPKSLGNGSESVAATPPATT